MTVKILYTRTKDLHENGGGGGVAGFRERFMQRSVCIRNSLECAPVFIDIRRDISWLLFDFTPDAGTQTPGLLVAF